MTRTRQLRRLCLCGSCWALLATVGVAPRRDFSGLEQRRTQAEKLFGKGKSQADVARGLGVSRQSVSRWYADCLADGAKGLAVAGRAGRLSRLDDAQLALVAAELEKGARAHGYPTLSCGPSRVWRRSLRPPPGCPITPGMSGGCCTRWAGAANVPPCRAVERDDEAIARWAAFKLSSTPTFK